MSAWQNIIRSFDFTPLLNIALSAIPALICITLHEISHGLVAYRLGDPTAKNAGRLSLNPIKHLDVFGFLMLIVAHVGWAKPVPIDMRYFKNPKRGMAITALAGPVSNFVITAIALLLFGFLLPLVKSSSQAAMIGIELLYVTAHLSLGLALFNLLPIPPLDGSKVLFSLIPDSAYMKLMRYERYGMILLVILAYTGVTGSFLSVIIDTVFDWFMHLAEMTYQWSYSMFIA